MIQLQIAMTGRGYSSKGEYRRFAEDTKTFASMDEAKAWLKKEYGESKRSKMFMDDENKKSVHIGYIYHFNNADWSHSPVTKWRQQDWVEFQSLKPLNLGVKSNVRK